jgi:hypothetical protein
MVTSILSILLSLIFAFLAVIHFNWALGSSWGIDAALPTKESGERVLNPKKIDCIFVGVGLLFFATFYLDFGFLRLNLFSDSIYTIASWIVPSIFFLRAIGDFKYVGLFRKVKTTKFGKMDHKYFTPLCFLLALLGVVLNFVR